MRERDLRVLEFHKAIGLVAALAASESGRRAMEMLRPAGDPAEVAVRLRVTAEMVSLRGHAGALPMQEFADQREVLLAAARERRATASRCSRCATSCSAARHVAAFMCSRVEPYPHLAAAAQNLAAPKELADALLGALADDGGLLDEASPQLARLRIGSAPSGSSLRRGLRVRSTRRGWSRSSPTTWSPCATIVSSCRSSSTTPSGWRESCRTARCRARRCSSNRCGRSSSTTAC